MFKKLFKEGVLFPGFAQFRKTAINSKGIVLALITRCLIAAYTIVDGTGTRVAQNAMIYFGMMSICSSVVLLVYFQRFHNGVAKRVFTEGWRFVLSAGQPLLSPLPFCCWQLPCKKAFWWTYKPWKTPTFLLSTQKEDVAPEGNYEHVLFC